MTQNLRFRPIAAALGHTDMSAVLRAISEDLIDIESLIKCLAVRGLLDPNKADRFGRTLLHMAVDLKNAGLFRCLVENAGGDPTLITWEGEPSPMGCAAQNGDIDIIKCCGPKADPNKTDDLGQTPLFRAAASGHLDVVKYLAEEAKADPNKADNDGRTPIDGAASNGHNDVVSYLNRRSPKRKRDEAEDDSKKSRVEE